MAIKRLTLIAATVQTIERERDGETFLATVLTVNKLSNLALIGISFDWRTHTKIHTHTITHEYTMNLINLLLCAIKTSLSYYRPGIMRGLLSSFAALVGKRQCALDINRYFSHNCSSEGRIGKERKGEREGEGNVPKESTSQKLPRDKGHGTRDTGHGTRGRHTPRLCLQCSCCCCHFKLPIIDEFAKIQTDSQTGAGKRERGAVCGVQFSLSGSQCSARRSCPEIACSLASLALSCPMPVNILLVGFLGRAQAPAR